MWKKLVFSFTSVLRFPVSFHFFSRFFIFSFFTGKGNFYLVYSKNPFFPSNWKVILFTGRFFLDEICSKRVRLREFDSFEILDYYLRKVKDITYGRQYLTWILGDWRTGRPFRSQRILGSFSWFEWKSKVMKRAPSQKSSLSQIN